MSHVLVDLFCRSRRVPTAGSRSYREMNCTEVLWWFRLGAGFCVESLARFCSSAWKDYNGMLLPELGKWAEACWKAYKKAILGRRLHCSSPGKQKGCGSCSATSAELIGINLHGSSAAPEIPSRSTPGRLAVLLYIFLQCTKYLVSSRNIILSKSCREGHVVLSLLRGFSGSTSIAPIKF